MGVTININGNVNSLVVNSGEGTEIICNNDTVWEEPSGYPPYLTFSSAGAFTLDSLIASKTWDGTIETSTDHETWTEWLGNRAVSSTSDGTKHVLYVRGSGNTVITGANESGWYLDGTNVSCDGDIRTLLDYADPENTTMADKCFMQLFAENDNLIKGPDLPAMTLAQGCYNGIYMNSAITELCELPAETLAVGCYANICSGCTSLTTIRPVGARSLASTCFMNAFSGCTSLATLLAITTQEFAINSCNSMYKGCPLIKVSETQTGEYQTPYRLPANGTATAKSGAFSNMLYLTGGTFNASPTVNTTYYTSNTVV